MQKTSALGCIVEAARKEAIGAAFCLVTDATGVSIQPTPRDAVRPLVDEFFAWVGQHNPAERASGPSPAH